MGPGRFVLFALTGVTCLACDSPTEPADVPVVSMSSVGSIEFDVRGHFDRPVEEAYFTDEQIYANMLIALPQDGGERIRKVRMNVTCPGGMPLGTTRFAHHDDRCQAEFMFATIAGGILFFRGVSTELRVSEGAAGRRTGRLASTLRQYVPGSDAPFVIGGYQVAIQMEFDLPGR